MSQDLTAQDVIASALRLPLKEQAEVLNALLMSVEQSEAISSEEMDAAWSDEIKSRLDDIDSGRVETIPSSEVWKRIGGKPNGDV